MPTKEVLIITDQYRMIVGSLEEMFQAARIRTNQEGWRQNGVGSCKEIHDQEESEQGLEGPAKKHLISLRKKVNQEVPGQTEFTGCPYHRTGVGCVLGNLKAPVCIRYIDNGWEWQQRFGLNTRQLRTEIDFSLKLILSGQLLDPSSTTLTRYIRRVDKIRQQIEKEPVLDGSSTWDKVRLFYGGIIGLPQRLHNHWTYTH